MASSPGSIHEIFLEYSGAQEPVQADSFVRDQLHLEFDSGAPLAARLRDLRPSCCMIDVGNSIFTLAFSDILNCVMPEHPGAEPLLLRVRVGCLARDANARFVRSARRSSWREHSASTASPTRSASPRGTPLNQPAEQSAGPAAQSSRAARMLRSTGAGSTAQESREAHKREEQQRQSLEDIEKMLKEVW